MEEFDFTEEEIQEQLEKLGYFNIPKHRLLEFKRDLEELIHHEKSKNSSGSTVNGSSATESEGDHRYSYHTGIPYRESVPATYAHRPTSAAVLTTHIPSQYREETHEADPSTSQQRADTSITSSSSSDRRVIKRRVARKVDGQSMISDEITDSEMGDISSIEERLGHLDLDRGVHRRRWMAEPPHPAYIKRPQSAEPVFRLPDDYDGPKALIKPMKGTPHTRNVRKNDPVLRYQQYSQCWQSQRAPGEKKHSQLRWSVREQMLYHDEVVAKKPNRVYVPNNFVIPSDKKRKNLRWAVRQDMAQGVVPPSIFD